MASTHPKNISQHGNLPQIGVKIKNCLSCHHLALVCFGFEERRGDSSQRGRFWWSFGTTPWVLVVEADPRQPKNPQVPFFFGLLRSVWLFKFVPKEVKSWNLENSWIFKTRIKSLHATTFFEIKRGLIGLIRNSINAGWCDRKSVFNP